MVSQMDYQARGRQVGVWKANFPERFVSGRGQKLQMMCKLQLRAKEFEQKLRPGKINNRHQMTSNNVSVRVPHGHAHTKPVYTQMGQTTGTTESAFVGAAPPQEGKKDSPLNRGVLGYVKRQQTQKNNSSNIQGTEMGRSNDRKGNDKNSLQYLNDKRDAIQSLRNERTLPSAQTNNSTNPVGFMNRNSFKSPTEHSSPREERNDNKKNGWGDTSRSSNNSSAIWSSPNSSPEGWKGWSDNVVAQPAESDESGILEENDDLNDAFVDKYVLGWNHLDKQAKTVLKQNDVEKRHGLSPQKLLKMTNAKSTTNADTSKMAPGSSPGRPKTNKEKWGGHELEGVNRAGWGEVANSKANWYEDGCGAWGRNESAAVWK